MALVLAAAGRLAVDLAAAGSTAPSARGRRRRFDLAARQRSGVGERHHGEQREGEKGAAHAGGLLYRVR